MQTYQYVNTQGGLSTITANSANEALSSAQNKASDSGVQLLPTPQGTPAQGNTNPPSAVITSGSLQNQTPITVPQPNPTVAPVAPTVPTPAENMLATLDLTANEEAAQSSQENIVAKMLENITNQQGESAFRTQLLNESGIGNQRKELLDLTNQIRTKQAEIQQDDITLISKMRSEENRDTLLPFAQNAQAKLAGDAAIIRALKTSEIGVLNALAIGKQGDIQLAKDTINEAVDAKFAPYKEQNALYEAQLKAIQPFLDKAEKKQALAQQTKLNLAMKEIDKVADFQKQILSNAISSNAPQSVLNAINGATSIDAITKAGKGYMADPLDRSIKAAQLRKLNLENTQNDPEIQNALVSSIINEKDPSKLITQYFKANPKVKTNPAINDAAAVVSSATELAKTLNMGKVKGYGFLGGGFLPEALSGQKAIATRGDVAALNLKVQQWASGASLTAQQTEYVNKMIPEANDTDKTFRTKINNLTNYMLGDMKGRITTQGGYFDYIPTDVFTINSVTASPKTAIPQAISAGYQPAEVVEYVITNYPEQAAAIQQARDAGYTDNEIIQFLSTEG